MSIPVYHSISFYPWISFYLSYCLSFYFSISSTFPVYYSIYFYHNSFLSLFLSINLSLNFFLYSCLSFYFSLSLRTLRHWQGFWNNIFLHFSRTSLYHHFDFMTGNHKSIFPIHCLFRNSMCINIPFYRRLTLALKIGLPWSYKICTVLKGTCFCCLRAVFYTV